MRNFKPLFVRRFVGVLTIAVIVLAVSLFPVEPAYASINGWYGGDPDNVLDDGNINGWADKSTKAYGVTIAGGKAYRFGPRLNNYGTWGQLIYSQPSDLVGPDTGNPSGLNGYMPANPAPDGGIWVQGHLVNGECGGDGSLANNLTPISNGINRWHSGKEAVLKRLVNRGTSGSARMFNPHGIANSRLIYRTHALPPKSPSTEPDGIAVSLGIVINNVMQSETQVQNHFATATGNARWFNDAYYGNGALKADRQTIVELLGGTQINY